MKTFFLWLLLACPLAASTLPPEAPTQLTASFRFEEADKKGDRVLPSIALAWEPSSPGSFLLAGYVVLKRLGEDAAWTAVTETARVPLAEENYLDLDVTLGKAYAYQVLAVDTKGNSSAPSAEARLDLGRLPESFLAPEPPRGLTALGGRDLVTLQWSVPAATADPVSHYVLYRAPADATGSAEAPAEGLTVFGSQAADPPPHAGQLYAYWLRSVDSKGRTSELSSRATASITGTLPPSPPRSLSAKPEVEKIKLTWSPATAGTAPVSEYRIRRGLGDGSWKTFPARPPGSLTLTESGLEPEEEVQYEVTAVDAEGNSSSPVTVRAAPLPPRFIRNSVILMPTAYPAREGMESGPGADIMATFFVGTFFESYRNQLGRDTTLLLSKLLLGTATLNFKWSLVPETRFTPAFGSGVYLTSLINSGQPGADTTQTLGTSSGKNGASLQSLGGLYAVVSKSFGRRRALHFGFMRGNMAEDFTAKLPPSWELTLRHLTPGGDIADLMTSLVDPAIPVTVNSSPDLFFAGIQLPFTVPFGFASWRTGLLAEALAPYRVEGDDKLPWMINFHVINMPLFSADQFMFSFFKFYQGYEIAGFYNVNYGW